MNKPEFNDISYWYQKAQSLDAVLEECHEILGDNRNIITICRELVAYKNLADSGNKYAVSQRTQKVL